MVPITNDTIIRNPGVTAKKSNVLIIMHISTARTDEMIITLLFLMM